MFLEFQLDSKPYRQERLYTSTLGKLGLPQTLTDITVMPSYEARTRKISTTDSRVVQGPRSIYPVLFADRTNIGRFTLKPNPRHSEEVYAVQTSIVCGTSPSSQTQMGYFNGDVLVILPTAHADLVYLGSTTTLSR